MLRKFLLSCGILSSLLYIGMNIFIPGLFEGYNVASQTVSELSAFDAPTRTLWVIFAVFYIVLFGAFGIGVLQTVDGKRPLYVAGVLIMVYTLVNVYWPPMHLRGNDPTISDALHIVWAIATIILMMLIMGFGAAAFGKAFRVYTVLTFIAFIVFGAFIGMEAPGISNNTPTPYIGIWERINIGVYMIWVMVFAGMLLREEKFYHLGCGEKSKGKSQKATVQNVYEHLSI